LDIIKGQDEFNNIGELSTLLSNKKGKKGRPAKGRSRTI